MVMGMAVTCKNFGSTKEGHEVKLYTMENKNGMVVTVTNYGVNIVNVIVPFWFTTADDTVTPVSMFNSSVVLLPSSVTPLMLGLFSRLS